MAVFLIGLGSPPWAQLSGQDAVETQTVVVTGVRAALEQSLRQKRNADAVVEVVTAEDIGKMPDKNVADAIQRLPGVNTQSSAGGEGGFGENDRVSLRGTSPSLQQTLFNGHAISTGDWFLLNQIGGNVGRSSSFSLLPSELVGSIVVQKSPTADLVEGGVSGAINVITRPPLDFRKPLTVEGSIQANYNDLSEKTEPHRSALVSWNNPASTFATEQQVVAGPALEVVDAVATLDGVVQHPAREVVVAHAAVEQVGGGGIVVDQFVKAFSAAQGIGTRSP